MDLYRLLCYFHSSEYLAGLSEWDDFCPWQSMREEFQDSEIIRILLQTAVAIRFIGSGQAVRDRVDLACINEPVVGRFFKDVTNPVASPLTLRDACNQLIHAKNITADSNGSGNPYQRFLKPMIICFEDFEQERGWKAEIDLLPFIQQCDALALEFS
jgi:hypothetical protein